jgi:hypothetical protein
MLLKIIQLGAHAGDQIWGCSEFPWCPGLVPIENSGEPDSSELTEARTVEASQNSSFSESNGADSDGLISFDDAYEEQLSAVRSESEITSSINNYLSESLDPSVQLHEPIADRRRKLIKICRIGNAEHVIEKLRSAAKLGRDATYFEAVEQMIEQLDSDVKFISDMFFGSSLRDRPSAYFNN